MPPSTLFPRHTFQHRLYLKHQNQLCLYVCLKIRPSAFCLTGRPTLHRMALFVNPNPAQMAVDAKSVTTPTCTATTPGPPILKPNVKNQKTNSGGVRRHKSNQNQIFQRKKTIKKTKIKYFLLIKFLKYI